MMKTGDEKNQYRVGILAAVFCGFLWGILPIYWDALKPISSFTIIIYRVVMMSLMCYIACIFTIGPVKVFKGMFGDSKRFFKYLTAGILITLNWSTYIWAVNAGYVIQTCMGYFIEPLMVCVFGRFIFKEKLNNFKRIALGFAVVGLLIMIVGYRELPAIALGLAASFATYAAIKKTYKLPVMQALFYETVTLIPAAIAIILYMEFSGVGLFGNIELKKIGLLSLCGLLTAVPLGLFSFAASKLPLVTLGLTEYISPSISLILGIYYFNEPFDLIQFSAFVSIWIGLGFFTYGEYRDFR
ncbi:EamA family transporter RarD [Anaerovoracaceae bacterium SGI.195]